MQHELEQLTKELRQVNLQQFIKQTGTKVTVLPAEPDEGTHASRSTGTTPDTDPIRYFTELIYMKTHFASAGILLVGSDAVTVDFDQRFNQTEWISFK